MFFIEQALSSENSLKCMYAIASCVYNDFKTPKTVRLLRKLKNSNLIEWNSWKISSCANAALDLLGIEPYRETDLQTIDFINTCFLIKK